MRTRAVSKLGTKSSLLLVCVLIGLLAGCRRGGRGSKAEWESMLAGIEKEFPDVRQLSTADLASWLQDTKRKPPVLLDARQPEEYAVSHLENARLVVPGSDPRKVLGDVSPQDAIVVYCSVGYRSSDLAERLTRLGYENVFNLRGSVFAWANEDRPLYRREEPTRFVHPFDSSWGRFLNPEHHPAQPE